MTKHDWILDVFEDLETYAALHGLKQIATDIIKHKKRAQQELADHARLNNSQSNDGKDLANVRFLFR
ncbi:MAG: hypothetical protein WA790_01790 [Sulfitobacter sp.]